MKTRKKSMFEHSSRRANPTFTKREATRCDLQEKAGRGLVGKTSCSYPWMGFFEVVGKDDLLQMSWKKRYNSNLDFFAGYSGK
jgi:hypothetical protein